MRIRGQSARVCPRHALCHLAAYGHERALRATRNPPSLPSSHESAPPRLRPSRSTHAKCAHPLVPVHELTQIFTNQKKIRAIREYSWTARRGLSPCHFCPHVSRVKRLSRETWDSRTKDNGQPTKACSGWSGKAESGMSTSKLHLQLPPPPHPNTSNLSPTNENSMRNSFRLSFLPKSATLRPPSTS